MLVSLSLILVAACLVPAAAKLTGQPRMRASAAHLGLAWERYRLIGVAELAAAAGVLAGLAWPPIGVLAGLALALLLGAAILTHVRSGDTGRELVPALLILAIDALYLVVAVTG